MMFSFFIQDNFRFDLSENAFVFESIFIARWYYFAQIPDFSCLALASVLRY